VCLHSAALAGVFTDCHMLDIVGDESKDTRKMMVRARLRCAWRWGTVVIAAHIGDVGADFATQMDMKVKVTPSFFVYRNGKEVYTQRGVASNSLPRALTGLLEPHEAGKDYVSPSTRTDSDTDED
jgi:hypothetical protein